MRFGCEKRITKSDVCCIVDFGVAERTYSLERLWRSFLNQTRSAIICPAAEEAADDPWVRLKADGHLLELRLFSAPFSLLASFGRGRVASGGVPTHHRIAKKRASPGAPMSAGTGPMAHGKKAATAVMSARQSLPARRQTRRLHQGG